MLAALLVGLALNTSPSASVGPNISIEVLPAAVVESVVVPPVDAPAVVPPVPPVPVAKVAPHGAARGATRGGGVSVADPRGTIRMEASDGGETSHGDGDGAGNGIGHGLGVGDASGAAAIAALEPPPAPPPAPVKVSKARPAILIYPRKHGTDDDPAVFVAQVTIDDEGFVVGAHVKSGEGGVRGEQAAALIWRFRYDPARDDDGRAIRSTLQQPFLVGR
ncbi:MAG TPA: hypothetical protein VGM39_04740 [Kofleriaceae bacterium]